MRYAIAPYKNYSRFTDYGDGDSYRDELENIRCDFGSGEKEEK